MPSSSANLGVIILAAGQGKRMQSPLPKVLHEIGGVPLIFHILSRVSETVPDAAIALVLGHGREQVESAIRACADFGKLKISSIHQAEQRGTGHAARCAMDSPWGEKRVEEKSTIVVLPGDLPLISAELVSRLSAPLGRAEVMRLLSCVLPDPAGYGRVIRKGKSVSRIVEEKDANTREKQVREVGTSIYAFQAAFLKAALSKLSDRNAQGEYYLTDVIAQASKAKKKIDSLVWSDPDEVRGINDSWELTQARAILNTRILRNWAKKGVKFTESQNTWIDVGVRFEGPATVGPGAVLQGKTEIGMDAALGPSVVLRNVSVGAKTQIKTGSVAEDSKIGSGAMVGPYAHLRPESQVGDGAKIGNFVELKKTRIGAGTSVAHLSYLGDAEVGSRVNIGCGFVTCNFDGRTIDGERKHRTVIEDDVFLGSDCQAVAPVRIGKGAYIASGSTITEDVEPEALAIARSRQVNKPGYARKLKQGD